MALRDGALSADEKALGEALKSLPKDSPFAGEIDAIALSVQADQGGLSSTEGKLLAELVGLTQGEVGSHQAGSIKSILTLVKDFVGPLGQPTGLTQMHAEGVRYVIQMIKGGKHAPEQVDKAICQLEWLSMEGADPKKGVYSGLTQAGIDSLINSKPAIPPAPPPNGANTESRDVAEALVSDSQLLDIAYQGNVGNRMGFRDGRISLADINARLLDPKIDPVLKTKLEKIVNDKGLFDKLSHGKPVISVYDLAKHFGLTPPEREATKPEDVLAAAMVVLKDAQALDVAYHKKGVAPNGVKDGRITGSDLASRINDPSTPIEVREALKKITPAIFDALRGNHSAIVISDL